MSSDHSTGHYLSVTGSDVTLSRVFRDWLRLPYVEQLLPGNCMLTPAAKPLLQWTENFEITFYRIPLSRDLKSAVFQVT
jgi:hypothetical protein